MFSGIESHILQSPPNVVVAEGASVNFTCVSNKTERVVWKFDKIGGSQTEILFTGLKLANRTASSSQFNVTTQSGLLASSSLIISYVKISDAGRYSCEDITTNTMQSYAELVVLGRPSFVSVFDCEVASVAH